MEKQFKKILKKKFHKNFYEELPFFKIIFEKEIFFEKTSFLQNCVFLKKKTFFENYFLKKHVCSRQGSLGNLSDCH